MSPKKVVLFGVAWLVLITGLHAWLNVNWDVALNNFRPPAQRKIIDARLKLSLEDVKKGRTAGPFDSAAEMAAALNREIRKMSPPKPKPRAR